MVEGTRRDSFRARGFVLGQITRWEMGEGGKNEREFSLQNVLNGMTLILQE